MEGTGFNNSSLANLKTGFFRQKYYLLLKKNKSTLVKLLFSEFHQYDFYCNLLGHDYLLLEFIAILK